MIDHGSFDRDIDAIREECLEWDRISSLLISMMAKDKEFILRNPCLSYRLSRLEKQFKECRENIEHHIFAMVGHNLYVCDDNTLWLHSESRKADNSTEWIEKRHGKPYVTTDTQIRRDMCDELYNERKGKIMAERTVKELQAQIKKLQSELESQKKATENLQNKK